MAAIDNTRAQLNAVGIAGHIGHTFASIIGVVTNWNDVRVTRKSLSALSDRELDDIGLIRGDIDEIR